MIYVRTCVTVDLLRWKAVHPQMLISTGHKAFQVAFTNLLCYRLQEAGLVTGREVQWNTQ